MLVISCAAIIIGLLGVWTELEGRYAVLVPAPGGTLRESIVGTPHLINPLLATTEVDRDLTNILYAGLMKSDGKGGRPYL